MVIDIELIMTISYFTLRKCFEMQGFVGFDEEQMSKRKYKNKATQ